MSEELQQRWHPRRTRPTWQAAFANVRWLGFDKIARLLISLIVGAWVARHLGPGDYGVMNYALAVIMLVSVFPGLGLDSIVRRELLRAPENRGRWLGTAFGLRLIAGLLTYGALCVGVLRWEHDAQARFIILLNGLALVQSSTLVFDFWFQTKLQSKYTVLAQNIAFAFSSAGRVALILMDAGLEAFGILLLLDLPVTTALSWYFYRRHAGALTDWRWDGAAAGTLLRESWPLALSSIAALIYLRIDQVMLKQLADATEAGRYAAAVRLAEVWNFIPGAVTLSLVPLLAQARTETDPAVYEKNLRRCLGLVSIAAWAAALSTMLIAPWLVTWIFGPAYAGTAPFLIVLAASLPLVSVGVVRQEHLVFTGQRHFQLIATLVGALVNIGLNLWWIPRWGGLGAAGATLVAYLCASLLTSFCWAPTRVVGRWQWQALVTPWRSLDEHSRHSA